MIVSDDDEPRPGTRPARSPKGVDMTTSTSLPQVTCPQCGAQPAGYAFATTRNYLRDSRGHVFPVGEDFGPEPTALPTPEGFTMWTRADVDRWDARMAAAMDIADAFSRLGHDASLARTSLTTLTGDAELATSAVAQVYRGRA